MAVVLVGEHPHAVAARRPSEIGHRDDQRLSDALVPERLVDTKFVQKHLCPLVGMRHLDPGHETGGRPSLVRNQQVMAVLSEKPTRRWNRCFSVQEVADRKDCALASV